MRAFHLTAENAMLFFELCKELHAETEEERTAILDAMAEAGRIGFVVETPKTKEEYIAHISKQFDVGIVESNGSISPIPKGNDQPKGDSNGRTTE